MNTLLATPRLGAFVISFMVEALFTTVLVFAMSKGIADNPTVQILMGALVASQTQVVNYWIGSSAGSAKKDDVIATQVATASAVQGAAVPPKTGP